MLKLSYCIHSKVERRFQVRDCPQSLRIRQDQSVYETSPFPKSHSLPVNASNPILSSQRITLSSKKTNILCRYVRWVTLALESFYESSIFAFHTLEGGTLDYWWCGGGLLLSCCSAFFRNHSALNVFSYIIWSACLMYFCDLNFSPCINIVVHNLIWLSSSPLKCLSNLERRFPANTHLEETDEGFQSYNALKQNFLY